MELLGMSINEILILTAIILILIDIFFVSDLPTLIAYIIITFTIAKEINLPILYQIAFGLLILFGLVVFHYKIWRTVLSEINDRFIAPTKHEGGLEGLIGKQGVIKEIEGKKFILINDEVHLFETKKDLKVGDSYTIIDVKSNKLII